MKNPLVDFLFGQCDSVAGVNGSDYVDRVTSFTSSTSEIKSHAYHSASSFIGTGAAPVVTQPGPPPPVAPSTVAAPTAAQLRPGAAPSANNPSGYNQYPDPEVKGIDPAAEISRIENNIFIYHIVISAAAIGIGVTMCMFVRSILKPAKGFHGGDSDDEMDSDGEDDDSEES